MTFTRSIIFFLFVCTALACGDDSTPTDAAADTGTDAAADSAADATTDTGADASRDSGGDASGDASRDATPDGAPDATADATPDATTDAGGCTDCITDALSWGFTGGFVAFTRESTLSACRTYTLEEMRFIDPPMTTSCTNEVPCLGDAVVMADVLGALANDDVVAAFAAAPITYGRDMRPIDAPIFQVTQSGRTFLVGSPCAGGMGCTPIPAGVQALVDLLRALDAERLAEPDCSTVFP